MKDSELLKMLGLSLNNFEPKAKPTAKVEKAGKSNLPAIFRDYIGHNSVQTVFVQYLKPLMINAEFTASKEWRTIVENLTTQKTAGNKVNYYYQMLAFIFSSKIHLQIFLGQFSANYRKLFADLVWREPIIQPDIENNYKIKVFTPTRYGKDLNPEFLLFRNENRGYREDIVFSFPSLLMKHLQQFYEKPDFLTLKPVEKPEAGFVYTNNNDIFNELPILLTLYQQGVLKTTKAGVITAATARKIVKQLNLKEFFPDDDELGTGRTVLLYSLILNFMDGKVKTVQDTLSLIKQLFSKLFLSSDFIISLFKGIRGFVNIRAVSKYTELNKQLVQFEVEKWYDIRNLKTLVYVAGDNFEIVYPHSAYNYLYFDIKSSAYRERDYLNSATYQLAIVRNFMTTSFAIYAAYGLLDIAYDKPDTAQIGESYYSDYEKIKYIRLTKLGAYILGMSKNFEAPKVDLRERFILNDDMLIIRTQPNDNEADIILRDIGTKLSSNRYKIDMASFLKNCKKSSDIIEKINYFESIVSEDPPRIWTDFFKKVRSNSTPLEKVTKYMVFKIPKNADLIALFAKDSQLKKMVVKAEDYHVLIDKTNLPNVQQRLKEFGYLLPSYV